MWCLHYRYSAYLASIGDRLEEGKSNMQAATTTAAAMWNPKLYKRDCHHPLPISFTHSPSFSILYSEFARVFKNPQQLRWALCNLPSVTIITPTAMERNFLATNVYLNYKRSVEPIPSV
jgi:hypothetical protein